MALTGYEYIAEILKSEQVEWLACFPQSPLIEAAAAVGIRPIAFRHERGALMAADGFSRTSDREKFGVAAIQSQAGAENAVGGLAQAAADNIPILLLPDGNGLNAVTRPNFSATRTYREVAKQVEPVLRSDQIGVVMRRAFHALKNGPPGPIVVELTSDVCRQEVPIQERNYKPPLRVRQSPADSEVAAAIRLLKIAKCPLIWAGAGVLSAKASDELVELAELTGIPVFCTMPGKSAIPDNHPLSLGSGSGVTTLAAKQWLAECDVLIALGSSLTKTPYGQAIRSDIRLIHNTSNVVDLNKDETVEISLLGDTKLVIKALIERLKKTRVSSSMLNKTTDRIQTLKGQWLSDWRPVLTDNSEPLNYYRVVHALNQVLDTDNSIVTHDAGAPRDCMVPFYQATVPHSYVGWGKTTHLGFGLPMMIGVKLANPDKFCINVMGDGAFGMSGFDLETAVRANIPITTLVLNNGGMSTYSGRAQGLIGPMTRAAGVSTMYGNYAAIAEAFGARGIEVNTADELHTAIEQAQKQNRAGNSVLIDVHSNIESRRSI